MRILIASDDPHTYTAYSQQAWGLAKYLKTLGHHVDYYGLQYLGRPKVEEDIPVWGNTSGYYSTLLTHYLTQLKSDFLITINDPLRFSRQLMQQVPVWVPFCPVDTEPISPGLKGNLQSAYRILTPTRWSQAEINGLGLKADYTPHFIDLDFWKTPGDRAGFRKRLHIPEESFMACMVGMDNDYPFRKGFDLAIMAWAEFIQDHPDSVLFIFTEVSHVPPNGVSVAHIFNALNLPSRNYRIIDQGFYSQGLEREYLRDLYYASDILFQPSTGEGFGIPVVEAQACGLPVLGNNFTALKETIKVGWKLNTENPAHGDLFFHPLQSFRYRSNHRILAAFLNLIYDEFRDVAHWADLKRQAQEAANEYGLSVLDTHWKPVFEDIELNLKAQL